MAPIALGITLLERTHREIGASVHNALWNEDRKASKPKNHAGNAKPDQNGLADQLLRPLIFEQVCQRERARERANVLGVSRDPEFVAGRPEESTSTLMAKASSSRGYEPTRSLEIIFNIVFHT